MNDFPIRLKTEDSPDPADPQAAAIEHMAAARALAEESRHLSSILTRWGNDPVQVFRQAQAHALEIAAMAARVEAGAESMLQAYRFAGAFSSAYTTTETKP